MSEVNGIWTKSTSVVWLIASAQEAVALINILKIRSVFPPNKTKALSLLDQLPSADLGCVR